MPCGFKLCSFNCVYCHYGWTREHTCNAEEFTEYLPALGEVVSAVKEALQSDLDFDYITFSGNGEPTLYPFFGALVDEVAAMRKSHRPGARIALLSNSTGLLFHELRETIGKIDLPVFKLDAGTVHDFTSINRPARDVGFDQIVRKLESLEGIYIQSVMIDGDPSNVGNDQLDAYFSTIKRIMPREVHIYSIDRPVPNMRIVRVPPEELNRIATKGAAHTGVPFRAFYICRDQLKCEEID